jgi:cell division protein FtsI/penicillin-binding protein 2
MNRDLLWRYASMVAVLSVAPLLIVLQLVRIQLDTEQRAIFEEQRKEYETYAKIIVPVRGDIYDRWGHMLAGSKSVYEVGVNHYDVRNPATIAMTLNVVLGIDYAQVLGTASIAASEKAVYSKITDNVSEEKIAQLEVLIEQMDKTYGHRRDKDAPSLSGLVFSPHLKRIYPEKSVASNIVGFVNQQGSGVFGVEEYYNDFLAGKARTVDVPVDPNSMVQLPVVPDGVSLVLTIDRAVQASMEQLVDQAIGQFGAESATIVVMAPKTGEVLAMASTPRLNLNEYWDYAELFPDSTPFNRAISQSYEPGSVYKVLTMASALDNGSVTEETTFLDRGVIEVGGTFIYNWNRGGWGPQSMQGCMQHSLNVCLAWVATQIGPVDFYAYMKSFGIGRATGIEMAGEAAGRLKAPGDEDWYDADLGTNAFGQGVAATPLQMAAAMSAVANDGKMMAPHIVRSMVSKGYQMDIEPRVTGYPIKPETARAMTDMLARSLEVESSDALVEGYRVAGKTGTGEIPTPFGYTSNQTNASFVGWGPVDDPQFLVYVWLEKPSASPWGSVVAAPVFREAVERLVVLMKIPPDKVRQQLLGQ